MYQANVNNGPVYVITAKESLRSFLVDQLTLYGFDTLDFPHIHGATKATSAKMPLAIIADLPGRSPDAMFLAELKLLADRKLPVIILSDDNSFEARLQAVRFGGDFYLLEPIDIHQLVSTLDDIVSANVQPDAGRILLVSDQSIELQIMESELTDRGFLVDTRSSPSTVLSSIHELEPDLVILSLYYQDCLGMELCQTIRQLNESKGLPVLLIGSIEAGEITNQALMRGADEYFFFQTDQSVDPIIRSIRLRIDRYRSVKSMMVKDSLTGLLNHTTTRRKLETEVLRSQRTGGSFAFAMVDIDKFKFVNDTYGHIAGDRVIQNLGRMLRKRTPADCTVGRYGGEEFAILIPEAVAPSQRVGIFLNQLREDFAGLEHSFQGDEFHCTFSCGVAFFPSFQEALSLNDAADQALYRAKQHGGNRVEIAQIT